jgi:hypothetical protein
VKAHGLGRATIKSSTMNEVPSSSTSQEPAAVPDQRPAKRQKVAIACLPHLGSRTLLTFLGLRRMSGKEGEMRRSSSGLQVG